jgi:hypothetical protein
MAREFLTLHASRFCWLFWPCHSLLSDSRVHSELNDGSQRCIESNTRTGARDLSKNPQTNFHSNGRIIHQTPMCDSFLRTKFTNSMELSPPFSPPPLHTSFFKKSVLVTRMRHRFFKKQSASLAARFVQFCDAFNDALAMLVDVPAFPRKTAFPRNWSRTRSAFL